jgi:hypothetical protein
MALEISKHVSSVVTHEILNEKKHMQSHFLVIHQKTLTSHLGKKL